MYKIEVPTPVVCVLPNSIESAFTLTVRFSFGVKVINIFPEEVDTPTDPTIPCPKDGVKSPESTSPKNS